MIDWVRVRFGRGIQLYVGIVNLSCMGISLVGERTSMGNSMFSMAGLGSLHVLLAVSIVTKGVAEMTKLTKSQGDCVGGKSWDYQEV